MKKSDLYNLIDSYVIESTVLDAKIRQIIKEELIGLISAYSGNSVQIQQEVRPPQITSENKIAKLNTNQLNRKAPIDKNLIIEKMGADFGKIGHIQTPQPEPRMITVPNTNGLIQIEESEIDSFGEEEAASVLDAPIKGKSSGNPLMDKILSINYSDYVKRTNKNK